MGENHQVRALDAYVDTLDLGALGFKHTVAGMLLEAKGRLGVKRLTGLADGGYYESMGLKRCEDEGITVYVPVPDRGAGIRRRGRYAVDEFDYDARGDCYYCPQGKRLTPLREAVRRSGKRYVPYTSRSVDCKGRSMRSRCMGEKARVRVIRRWEHQEVLDRHKERMERGVEKMKERGRVVEHPFETGRKTVNPTLRHQTRRC